MAIVSSEVLIQPTRANKHLRAASRPDSVGDWDLGELLGSGASSHVFAAAPKGVSAGQRYDFAAKLLKPELADSTVWTRQFRREGILGKLISHPHLMSVLDGGLKEQPYFLILPRLVGGTAAATLKRVGHFSCAHALWVARQASDGLAAIHGQGWLHGDVKPDNIFMSEQGHATLFDFGMATPRNQAGELYDRKLMGTFAYSAPEQFTSRLRIGTASDVYSLGVTLFELLTGVRPFRDNTASRLVEAHLHEIPPSPRTYVPHLPRDVASCVLKMLAKDPDRRPTTDGELQAMLVRLEIDAFALRRAA